jgi:hypothetical protein
MRTTTSYIHIHIASTTPTTTSYIHIHIASTTPNISLPHSTTLTMHSNAHCIPTLFTCFCTLDTGSAHYILTSCSCFRTLDRNEARGEVSSSELEGKGKNYEKTLFHLSDLLVSAQSFLRSRILSTLVSNPRVCVCVCARARTSESLLRALPHSCSHIEPSVSSLRSCCRRSRL